MSDMTGSRRSKGRQTAAPGILVREDEHALPFSKGLTANTIMACGLGPRRAYEVAQALEDRLLARGERHIDAADLRELTVATIRETVGDGYAEAFAKWVAVSDLDLPLIILIGGATGVGKSTIANQIASRLGIVRIISTDAIREVMKGVVSKEFAPTLHVSSFDAADVVRTPSTRGENPVITGFREQVSAVSVGVNALIARAIAEGHDVIIEGAHLAPGFIDPTAFGDDAVVVHLVVKVDDETTHRSHFHVRAGTSRARPVERYIPHFANIRMIQKHIASLALRHGVPVVANHSVDACVKAVVELITERAAAAAAARPSVAPPLVRAIKEATTMKAAR